MCACVCYARVREFRVVRCVAVWRRCVYLSVYLILRKSCRSGTCQRRYVNCRVVQDTEMYLALMCPAVVRLAEKTKKYRIFNHKDLLKMVKKATSWRRVCVVLSCALVTPPFARVYSSQGPDAEAVAVKAMSFTRSRFIIFEIIVPMNINCTGQSSDDEWVIDTSHNHQTIIVARIGRGRCGSHRAD